MWFRGIALVAVAMVIGCSGSSTQATNNGSADLVPGKWTNHGNQSDYCKFDSSGNLLVKVENRGTADAGPSIATVVFEGPNGAPVIRTILVPNTPRFHVAAPSTPLGAKVPFGAGNKTITISVDTADQVAESDETNNTVTVTCVG